MDSTVYNIWDLAIADLRACGMWVVLKVDQLKREHLEARSISDAALSAMIISGKFGNQQADSWSEQSCSALIWDSRAPSHWNNCFKMPLGWATWLSSPSDPSSIQLGGTARPITGGFDQLQLLIWQLTQHKFGHLLTCVSTVFKKLTLRTTPLLQWTKARWLYRWWVTKLSQ